MDTCICKTPRTRTSWSTVVTSTVGTQNVRRPNNINTCHNTLYPTTDTACTTGWTLFFRKCQFWGPKDTNNPYIYMSQIISSQKSGKRMRFCPDIFHSPRSIRRTFCLSLLSSTADTHKCSDVTKRRFNSHNEQRPITRTNKQRTNTAQ